MLRQRYTPYPHIPGPAQRAPRPFSPVLMANEQDADELIAFLRAMRAEIDGGQAEEDLLIANGRALAMREGGVAFIVRGGLGIEGSLGILFERPRLSRTYYLRAIWN